MSHEITVNPLPGVEAHPGTGHYGVYDHGAHVWAWQPDGAQPVVWVSTQTAYEPGRAIRGGIPICFPWFGAGPDGDQSPAHGFARITDWHLEHVDDIEGQVVVRYRLDDTMAGEQPHFPYPFEAALRIDFSADALQLALGVTNTGTGPFTYEEALHTYLAVGDIRQVMLNGLEGAPYLDKVAGGAEAVQERRVRFKAETDRVYRSDGAVVVVDPVLGRLIRVEKSGSANTVVWNPWADKAKAMSDFGDEEWRSMVCVEAANAYDDAITLQPGETHVLTQRVSLG